MDALIAFQENIKPPTTLKEQHALVFPVNFFLNLFVLVFRFSLSLSFLTFLTNHNYFFCAILRAFAQLENVLPGLLKAALNAMVGSTKMKINWQRQTARHVVMVGLQHHRMPSAQIAMRDSTVCKLAKRPYSLQ